MLEQLFETSLIFFFDITLATWSYGIKNGDAVLSLPFITETHNNKIQEPIAEMYEKIKEVYRNKF